jgi:hypothetical protein
MMVTNEQIKNLANMQLQLALLDGEKWAIEAVLGIKKGLDLTVAPGENAGGHKWEMEIHHVDTKSKV